jgi:ABC-2 type transport system permease protein
MLLRRCRGGTLGSCLCAVGILWFLILAFPNLSEFDSMALSEAWPEPVRALFGDPLQCYSRMDAWLHLSFFHMAHWLIGGLIAIVSASSIVSEELENRSLDLMLSYPVHRRTFIVSGYTGVAIALLLFVVLVCAATVSGVSMTVHKAELSRLLGVSVASYPLLLAVAAITLLVSLFVHGRVKTIVLSGALLFGMFSLTELSKLVPAVKPLSILSLFHFYSSGDILIRGIFDWQKIGVACCCALLIMIVGTWLFSRKDLV